MSPIYRRTRTDQELVGPGPTSDNINDERREGRDEQHHNQRGNHLFAFFVAGLPCGAFPFFMLVDESASAVQQNAFTLFKRGSSRLGRRTMQPRSGNDRRQSACAANLYPISKIFPVIHAALSNPTI
jgi:hypothetical protein